jgi:hypothetical protein
MPFSKEPAVALIEHLAGDAPAIRAESRRFAATFDEHPVEEHIRDLSRVRDVILPEGLLDSAPVAAELAAAADELAATRRLIDGVIAAGTAADEDRSRQLRAKVLVRAQIMERARAEEIAGREAVDREFVDHVQRLETEFGVRLLEESGEPPTEDLATVETGHGKHDVSMQRRAEKSKG